ncbi:lysophospholipid transporter LplT [Variovorax sp. OV329]|uniref:lysophospholipid transporter LplT n=1 Tax=Variovorax sp. OV329 TaxID=1882825 RepID=UPI0008F1BF74|nr:lysophospholipid transporter LplT [Variovorax sp. OV329]SFL86740.1 Major Facilitator Superfamily protein [Variovorax sp. OV329]
MPQGFYLLIAGQAISALADNALLIVAIALLSERSLPLWWAPLLKFAFTLAYVLLAPVIGPLADAIPKARLMTAMNIVKFTGVAMLLAGANPLLAFAVVGFGAAAYAPAKYGLVTEMVGPRQLVAANGWIEVSVVCAALLGTVAGGLLVADGVRGSAASVAVGHWLSPVLVPGNPSTLLLSMGVLLLAYLVSAAMNACVADSGARYAPTCIRALSLLREFREANRTLWRDRDGGLSLAVTTIFWGVGATLQFAVLKWATEVLGLSLERAAYLQAAVAVGVIAGAGLAGRHVRLGRAKRVLPAGVLLGLCMPLVASTDSLWLAVPLLALVGLVGGILVVPLNALLQHRGFRLLSAGRSIAVQGFNENLSVLAMLAGYAAMVAIDVPIVPLMWGFGLLVATAIALLIWRERCVTRERGPSQDSQLTTLR